MAKQYNCVITIEGVKSKKDFVRTLQTMLNDYDDMNETEDAPTICINVGKPYKAEK